MAPTKTFFDIVNELSMKSDKKLPNLKTPVKGKKGTSKFMRMKIHNAPYTSDYKKAMNASVHSADRKPEKYMKPDGKMGIRMVKVDKEVIKKESIDNHPKVKAARKAHAAGTWDGNVDKEGEAVVHINGKPHTVTNKYSKKKTNEAIKHTHAVVDPAGKVAGMSSNERDARDIARRHKGKVIKLKKPMSTKKGEMMINRLFKEAISRDQMMRMHQQAAASQKKNQAKRDEKEKKSMAAKADMDMKARKEAKSFNYFDSKDAAHAHAKKHGGKVFVNTGKGATKVKGKPVNTHVVIKKEEVDVDEALNLQQRMKRSRLMKRMKTRIAVGRKRAKKRMANKKTLEKRSMRQARNAIAKKLTRGIPKKELTFARKKEIEKRLEKPALQQRIKRLAKRMFKDVRKKEVQRKKG